MGQPDPQHILNQIKAIGISGLYSEQLEPASRKSDIALTRKKLSLVKKRMKRDMSAIKAAYDGHKPAEAQIEKRELAAYTLLEDLIAQIEIDLSELAAEKPGAQPPKIGDYIIRDGDSWRIVNRITVLRSEFRDRLIAANAAVEVAENELKQGYTYTSGAVILQGLVWLVVLFLIGAAICTSNWILLLYSGILIAVYAILARLFMTRPIRNAPERRQKLMQAAMYIRKLENRAETAAFNDPQTVERFNAQLRKIEQYAKQAPD